MMGIENARQVISDLGGTVKHVAGGTSEVSVLERTRYNRTPRVVVAGDK